MPAGYEFWSSSQRTVKPVLVVVAAMSCTITWCVSKGFPRQALDWVTQADKALNPETRVGHARLAEWLASEKRPIEIEGRTFGLTPEWGKRVESIERKARAIGMRVLT